MAEQFVTLHCEPCDDCVIEAWQRVVDGRLRWEEQEYCPRYVIQACGGAWGPAPEHVRARIIAVEGTVRVRVGGPDGVPLKTIREVMHLSMAELSRARADGFEATPVEAALLTGLPAS
ncbi:hypothetical protein [Streptomyces sp. NPDC002054]|uniref:hypothetical protein n=1 Tax=Streptomyces sp. NPDC002054 TaxID=3154663 RepID=UPI00331B941A